MKLKVVENHDGEGKFPLFPQGTAVKNLKECNNCPHWLSCRIDGYETYIPETYVRDNILLRDYDPTELIVEKGQVLTLIDIVFEWVYAKDSNDKYGWVPTSKVFSISK